MDKPEIKRINSFLSDVKEGLLEGDEAVTLQVQLTELCKVIKILRDEIFKTKDQQLKIELTSLEKRAKDRKSDIEVMLGLRN